MEIIWITHIHVIYLIPALYHNPLLFGFATLSSFPSRSLLLLLLKLYDFLDIFRILQLAC